MVVNHESLQRPGVRGDDGGAPASELQGSRLPLDDWSNPW
jgi:hypothetical protein